MVLVMSHGNGYEETNKIYGFLLLPRSSQNIVIACKSYKCSISVKTLLLAWKRRVRWFLQNWEEGSENGFDYDYWHNFWVIFFCITEKQAEKFLNGLK